MRPRASPLQIVDVHDEADAVRAHTEAIARPFDLTRPPLLRAYLYRVGPARQPAQHYLAFVVHHIVFDGWSAGVLGAHVAEHYQLARAGTRDKWDSLPWQYADFTAWQDALPRTDALAFWRRALENAATPVGFASARAGTARAGASDGFRRGLYRAPISPALRRELAAWCRSEKISLYTALLAAFHTLLHRVSGREDLTVGSPFANRTRPEAGTLIGPCFNVFPMRATFEDGPSFVRLARRLQGFVDQVREIEAVPFEVLAADALGSGAQAAARFPMWFSLQNFPFGAGDVGDTRWGARAARQRRHAQRRHAARAGVALVDSAGGMFGMWDYDEEKLELSR